MLLRLIAVKALLCAACFFLWFPTNQDMEPGPAPVKLVSQNEDIFHLDLPTVYHYKKLIYLLLFFVTIELRK